MMINKISILAFILASFNSIGQELIIPTVVHIVYNEPSQNMTDTEVHQLLIQVNENLKGASTNSMISREIFDTLRADTEIKLCLATLDPNGQSTTGIVRAQTTMTSLFGDFSFPTMISPKWDVTNFFNLWIYSWGPQSAEVMGGYAIIPGDMVFVVNEPVGCIINKDFSTSASIFANLATHEVGHYFGLLHTFDSDNINDTPCSNENIGPSSTCSPTDITINTCNSDFAFWNEDAPDMIENFMSYHFGCQNMFTKGQKEKIRQTVFSSFGTLLNNQNTACIDLTVPEISHLQPSFFPNPANEFIQIPGKADAIKLVSFDGRIVKEVDCTMENPQIAIQELSNGYYLLYSEQQCLGTLTISH
jgi:hypothetical protein